MVVNPLQAAGAFATPEVENKVSSSKRKIFLLGASLTLIIGAVGGTLYYSHTSKSASPVTSNSAIELPVDEMDQDSYLQTLLDNNYDLNSTIYEADIVYFAEAAAPTQVLYNELFETTIGDKFKFNWSWDLKGSPNELAKRFNIEQLPPKANANAIATGVGGGNALKIHFFKGDKVHTEGSPTCPRTELSGSGGPLVQRGVHYTADWDFYLDEYTAGHNFVFAQLFGSDGPNVEMGMSLKNLKKS